MAPLLKGKAAQVGLVLEEGTLFDPVFHNLADGAVDQDGEHEPFPADSIAYFTAMTARDGDVLFEMGPAADALDGTCELDAAGGLIACELPPEKSIGLDLGAPRYEGFYNLVIYPGGDEEQAIRYAEGPLLYSRRATLRPAEAS